MSEYFKVVEFKHGGNNEHVETVQRVSGLPIEQIKGERFKGQVWFTTLGIIVSTYDGENQRQLIVNADQSGRTEVLMIYSPVDSPMIIEHTVCEGQTYQQRQEGIMVDRAGIINPKIEEFMTSIPDEAAKIIMDSELWQYMTY